MNTCIYLRKSRKGDDPDETAAETLRRHREQLLALAKDRNLNVIDIKEEVVSGGSIAARPQMTALLAEVEEGRYDAVLVMDIDRLGRGSMIDQGIIGQTFRESETLVITPDKTYDLSDDLDEDYYDFYAFFARKELKQIKKRLQRGKMKSFREGNFVWARPPYGYVKSGRNEISPDPDTAPIVRQIFRSYLSGMSMGKIAETLNCAGIKTALGCDWTHKTISSILQNREYIGEVVCGKTKLVRGKTVRQPKESWICLPGKHEAIISEKDFLSVQEKLMSRLPCPVRKDRRLKNPLTGVLLCGFCGAPMLRKSDKKGTDRIRCGRSCPENRSSKLKETEGRYFTAIAICLAPRLEPISLPALSLSDSSIPAPSTVSGQFLRYQPTAQFLQSLLCRADPADSNAFLRSIISQGYYFRRRGCSQNCESFILHLTFRL